jgi:hypothetical protein
MKVVIIEQEENIARSLEKAISSLKKEFKKIDTVSNFPDFVRYLKTNEEPDLLLLDVYTLDCKALRFLQSGNFSFPLLFTNSLKAVDECFTVVPENSLHDCATINGDLPVKLKKAIMMKHVLAPRTRGTIMPSVHTTVFPESPVQSTNNYYTRFLVKNGHRLLSIKVERIALFYAEGRINFLKTKDNNKFIVESTIETLSNSLLDPVRFFRVNRSTIVSFDDIKDMFSYFGGRIKLVLNIPHQKDIIVSRDKVNEFKKWLGE